MTLDASGHNLTHSPHRDITVPVVGAMFSISFDETIHTAEPTIKREPKEEPGESGDTMDE